MPNYFTLGLLGHPISHSLSPTLHNAALQFAGLKGEYHLIDVEPKIFHEKFDRELFHLLPEGINGFNVTIPYKQNIFKLVSNYTMEAKLSEAVNTVKVDKQGNLSGHNTDLLGFKQAFIDSFALDLQNEAVLLIGAGGSAKAIIIALAQMGVAKILVKARNIEKLKTFINNSKSNLAKLENAKFKSPEIIAIGEGTSDIQNNALAAIINASPIGLSEEATPYWLIQYMEKLPPKCVCFDLVYRKDATKPAFAKLAISRNLQTIDGLSMLVHQARLSFKYWTGYQIPLEVLFKSITSNNIKTT